MTPQEKEELSRVMTSLAKSRWSKPKYKSKEYRKEHGKMLVHSRGHLLKSEKKAQEKLSPP